MFAKDIEKIAFDNSIEGKVFNSIVKMCLERAKLGNYGAVFKHVVGENSIETSNLIYLLEEKTQIKVLSKLNSFGYYAIITVEDKEDGTQIIELTVSWEDA